MEMIKSDEDSLACFEMNALRDSSAITPYLDHLVDNA